MPGLGFGLGFGPGLKLDGEVVFREPALSDLAHAGIVETKPLLTNVRPFEKGVFEMTKRAPLAEGGCEASRRRALRKSRNEGLHDAECLV